MEKFDAKEIYEKEIKPKLNDAMDSLKKNHIPALFIVAASSKKVAVSANFEPDRTPDNIKLAFSCATNPEVVIKAMQLIMETADKIGKA